jgi:hypothetical protein
VLVAHPKLAPSYQSSDLIGSQLRVLPTQVHHGLVDPLLILTWKPGLIPITGAMEAEKSTNLTLAATALAPKLPSQLTPMSNA